MVPMSFLPFLPKLGAMEILERHDQDQQQAAEMKAELGSSLFYSGMQSWDATSEAHRLMREQEAEFDASPEGKRYNAQVEAAQFMASATRGLHAFDQSDLNDPRVWVPAAATVVPEFWPGVIVKSDFNPGPTMNDDIPF